LKPPLNKNQTLPSNGRAHLPPVLGRVRSLHRMFSSVRTLEFGPVIRGQVQRVLCGPLPRIDAHLPGGVRFGVAEVAEGDLDEAQRNR